MAKRKKTPVSKNKKRVLSAAGLFAAGSILGAAITEPPDETPNRVYSLLDNELVETQETASEETSGNDNKFIQSIMTPETITEKVEEDKIFEEYPVPDADPETEMIANENSETEFVSNWFEEDIIEEEPPKTDIAVDNSTSDIFEWENWNDTYDNSENEAVAKDWFEEEPKEEVGFLSESPMTDSNWMTGQDESSIETETSLVILSETSSMNSELVAQLEGIAFFWAPSGEKVHIDPTCRSFKKGITFAGTLEEAKSVRTEGWCGICSKSVDPTYNFYATREILEACYTYNDFLAGIPADAFQD